MPLDTEELLDLHYARSLLEHPSLAARFTSMLGTPVEKAIDMLPAGASDLVHTAAKKAITSALDVALRTMDATPAGGPGPGASADRLHKLAVAATGAAGGAFGIGALAVELPITTGVILRSILDIARSEGEAITSVETKLACVAVLAFGGPRDDDAAADTGYFTVRAGLAQAVHEATRHIANRGLSESGAPALVRFISVVASRFGVVVSEKLAAQLVPVLGAAGGALVNTIFIDHFQSMARGHFIVRRLERRHGAEEVRRAWTTS